MKILKSIINIILTLFIIVGISVLIAYIIGIKPYVVMSGSMEPNIKIGSVSFVNTRYPYKKIQVGDVIAFKRDTIFATHRVVEITEEGFITKGDANNIADGKIVSQNEYVGKNILSIQKLGYIIQATQTKAGKVILITTIVFILACAFFVIKPEEKTQE
jgi:signal peptidase